MAYANKILNLVMSGGGVKGIAYVGMFEVAEKRGIRWANISGVSAGALAGAFAASGCNAYEMWDAMGSFDFKGIQLSNITKKVPAVARYLDFVNQTGLRGPESIRTFLGQNVYTWQTGAFGSNFQRAENRESLLSNIITYVKEGCLFDGDYLEEWVAKILAKKGIRTFGDLRGGAVDKLNPWGYRVRMTGVDCNRAKMVVLPDDVEFYGIDPDRFEVAKAVRISTCVPFAFKPVELKKQEGNTVRTYNLVDGGVFDRFPYWLIDSSQRTTVGFKLSGGEKPGFFSIDTPLNILKSLISAVQDIGIPEDAENNIKYIGEINTTKVHFLDFDLSKEEKDYLFNAGRQTAINLFNEFEGSHAWYRRGMFYPIFPILKRKWF